MHSVNKIANIIVTPTGEQIVFDLNKEDGGIKRQFKQEDQTEAIKVEKHFSYFQIENKLKENVYDLLDPVRVRMLSIDELAKQNKLDI